MHRSRPALAVLFLLLAAACTPQTDGVASESVAEEDRYGGTVVVGTFGDLQPMNRFISSDYNTNMIQREMLFMPLVKYDENAEPAPWLAASWDTVRIAPDTLELTFHLRDDIYWHDGEPTTARDVLFTYERVQEPETGFPNPAYFEYYAPEAELVDDHTIRFRLQPHAEFLEPWYLTPAMPEHILGDVPPAELMTHPFGTREPVGNGPFRFERRIPGQEWIFTANEDFPEALGGRPYLDRIAWRYIPETTTLLTETLTGRVDVYMGPLPEQAARLDADRNVRLLDFPFRQWVYIGWNTRLPQFEDPEVRRALTMAIDRQQIVDGFAYGYGEVGRGTVWPAHFAYDGDDPETFIPHDPLQAARILDEAGWRRGRDGIRRNADGLPFRFDLITNQGNETRKDIIEYVQAQLAPLGIDVRPRLIEWTTMLDQLRGSVNEEGVRERDFDAVVSSWVDAFAKNDADQLHSRGINNPHQYVGYSNSEVDRYLDTLQLITDRDEARPVWREYERLVAQEAPYTVLYFPQRLSAVRNRVRDVEMDVRGELINVTEWWIDPAQRRGR